MRARRGSSAALLVAVALALLSSAALTATLGSPRGTQDGLVVFSAPGSDAFRLSVAASTDSRWRPADGDWRAGGGQRFALPLTAEGGARELQPGDHVVVYVFIRNSSPDLSGAVAMSIAPPAQGAEEDEFFEHLGFHAGVDGRTVLEGTGRVEGVVDDDLDAGGVRRVALTVRLPADTPAPLLDRTTGVLIRLYAENR